MREDQTGVTITIPRELLPSGPPTTVTLLNCQEVFGVTAEQFRRLAKAGAFPVRREAPGFIVAMYEDVRGYFERNVRVMAPRARKAAEPATMSATEKMLLASGIRVKRPGHG